MTKAKRSVSKQGQLQHHLNSGVYKTRTGSDRKGLTKPRPDLTGLDRINKTWIGLRPSEKTRTGSVKNRIAINFR